MSSKKEIIDALTYLSEHDAEGMNGIIRNIICVSETTQNDINKQNELHKQLIDNNGLKTKAAKAYNSK